MRSRRHRWFAALIIGMTCAATHGFNIARAAGTPSDAIFPPGARPAGYKLGLLATACWMGGVWSDAEGVAPGAWRERDDQRCRDLVMTVYGQPSQARYEQLRENEARAVDDLLAKIAAGEPAPSSTRTVALFRDVAAAAHEGMLARRAADRVKVDYDANAVEAKLTDDQRRAAAALAEHRALDKLLIASDRAASDRRALGVLLALDRMEMARGLPKQLKFFALGHVLTTVFDVPPPPADALKPNANPRPGTWLSYISGVAARLGAAPPSDSAATNKTRETLAWTGVGRAFADRLRREAAQLPGPAVPELSRVAGAVATRLESERATAEALSKPHAAAERAATTP
jgi:hypothetical protein